MFHLRDQPLERGWVGRVDGDRVVHLAAQTLQHFFTGGASAREHAEYPLDQVTIVVPVLQPPSVRIFEDGTTFAFANPAAVVGPDAVVVAPASELLALARSAVIIGEPGRVGGVTALLELRAPSLAPPKDRDFALALGPLVVTTDELDGAPLDVRLEVDGAERLRGDAAFDWESALAVAAANTVLRTGDVIAGPPVGGAELVAGDALALHGGVVGDLMCRVAV
jgi:hypothetical protein